MCIMMFMETGPKKILGVITARGGSKGIPGKNIKDLGGKPLIAYTIEVAKESKLITDLILSTDNEEIIKVAKEYGCEVPFVRPKKLAEDKTPHLPVMQHAVEFMENEKGCTYDAVLILQPTSPLRTSKDIDGTIKTLFKEGVDSAASIVEVNSGEHPMRMKKLNGNILEPYSVEETTIRRQDLPAAYKRSSAVYAMKRDTFMVKNSLYGDSIAGYLVPIERYVDIDEPFDWTIAEHKLNELRNKGYKF